MESEDFAVEVAGGLHVLNVEGDVVDAAQHSREESGGVSHQRKGAYERGSCLGSDRTHAAGGKSRRIFSNNDNSFTFI